MIDLLNKQIVFIGGKGGVGKTTVSSAFALRAAKAGKRTLLVSTDPAHNLHDIFEREIQRDPTNVLNHLWALEIDPHYESHRYIDQVKENIRKTVSGRMLQEIEKQVEIAHVSPGANESALFDRMIDILAWLETDYDLIVFDTAPTGHTLRLLSLPELMGVWIDGMLQRRKQVNKMRETLLEEAEPPQDPIYEILTKRKLKFSRAREILLDAKRTAFSFVLIPERLPISETAKALPTLSKYKIPVDSLIINRILPESADGEFLKQRREQEKQYLAEIENRFGNYRLVKVPMLERDVCGLEALERISEYLF